MLKSLSPGREPRFFSRFLFGLFIYIFICLGLVGFKVKSLFKSVFLPRWWVVRENPWSPLKRFSTEETPRVNSNWVNINGVPDQEGVMEVAHLKDMLSSGASPDLEAFKLRDSDHFFFFGWWFTSKC